MSSNRLAPPTTIGETPLFVNGEKILHDMQALLGRKWHPILVYRLLEDEPMRFSSLKRSVDGISSKMLSESLADLTAAGIVERRQVSDSPVRVEYTLTEPGRALEPVIVATIQWGCEYDLDGPETGAGTPERGHHDTDAVGLADQNR